MATSQFSVELRKEELQGGFDVSDVDEAFELERLEAYPGEIASEFADIFSDVQVQAISSVFKPEIAPEPEQVFAPAVESVAAQEPVSVTMPAVETVSVPESVVAPLSESASSQAQSDEFNILDQELLDILKAELSASQVTTAKAGKPAEPAFQTSEFVEIDADPRATTFEFNEIEAKHPSEYQKDKPANQASSDSAGGYASYAGMAMEDIVSEQVEGETKQLPKKKSRKMLYLAVAGLLLAFGIGGTIYFLWPNIASIAGNSGTSGTVDTLTKMQQLSKLAEAKKTPEANLPHKSDEHAAGETTAVVTANIKPEATRGTDTVKHGIERPKEPPKEKNIAVEAANKSQRIQKKSTDEYIEAKPPKIPHKQEQIFLSRHIAKAEKPTESQKIKSEALSVPGSAAGVYTVQVYSTPSKDDAEEWLDKLRTKRVPGGFVSNQTVRGQTWYRVRFGNFGSREEAEAVARNNGFSKSWIDRIK